MWFYKYLLENVECLKEDWRLQMLIMHPDFQIGITNTSQMIEMDERNMIAIWSWGSIAMWLRNIELDSYEIYDLTLKKIFKCVSLCDIYTSEKYNELELEIIPELTNEEPITEEPPKNLI